MKCNKAQEKPALMGLLCIGLPEPIGLNQLNCVRLSSVSELNQTQSDGLSSICSEIELTESLVFDFVRLPNSIELNPRIEFDFRTFDLLSRENDCGTNVDPFIIRT